MPKTKLYFCKRICRSLSVYLISLRLVWNLFLINIKSQMDQCSICFGKLSQPASGKSDPPAKKARNNVKESSDVVVTPCGHAFHRSCLRGWFTYKKRGRINGVRPATRGPCPICRLRVRAEALYPLYCSSSSGSKESAKEKPVDTSTSYPHKISSNRIVNREERGNNHDNSHDQNEDENNDEEDEGEVDENHEDEVNENREDEVGENHEDEVDENDEDEVVEDVDDEVDEHANGFESDDDDEDDNHNAGFGQQVMNMVNDAIHGYFVW